MAKTPVTSRTKGRPKTSPAKRASVAPKSQPKARTKAAPTKRAATESRKSTSAARRPIRAASSVATTPDPSPVVENTSGQGKDAVVPSEIMEWSWGAFILNWIWAISHGVWIGLLTLVPGIGLFVAAYLGRKGNELAWRSKRWDSVEAFRSTQRRWRNAALIYFAAAMALTALLVVLTVTADTDPDSPTAIAEEQSALRTMTSDSGAVSIAVPDSWREELTLSEDADIQASDVGTDSYLIVLAEPKSDFPADATIAAFTTVVRDNLLASLEGGSQPQAATHLKVQGRPAIRSDLFGTIEGEKIAYVHTVIATPTRYVQVVSWMPRSNWVQNRDTLNRIAASFVEVKPA